MHTIGLVGYGNIGRAIHKSMSSKYKIVIADWQPHVAATQINVLDKASLLSWMVANNIDAVICATPYDMVRHVATAAAQLGIPYFDLTEDRATTDYIKTLESASVLVPQCGLAPGAVSIIGHNLISQFEYPNSLEIRVGALPQYPNNQMQYNLTWSTDGLINEYCHPGEVICNGRKSEVQPLEGYEFVNLNGKVYEAFNTSGGLGTLCETYDEKIITLNYKTMRYIGHHKLMTFLLKDLNMGDNQDEFIRIFNKAIPKTTDDVVLIMIKATGYVDSKLVEKNYVKEIKSDDLTAIQNTTMSGICGVVDSWFSGTWKKTSGFVKQEEIDYDSFISNDWGKLYDSGNVGKTIPVQ